MGIIHATGKQCGTCRFWSLPDLHAIKQYGNVGTCNVLTSELEFPFWATETLHRTKSYEGKYCDTWTIREKQK